MTDNFEQPNTPPHEPAVEATEDNQKEQLGYYDRPVELDTDDEPLKIVRSRPLTEEEEAADNW